MIIEDDNGRYKCACSKCGHQWYPRGGREPYKCPQYDCQTRLWNEDDDMLTQIDILQLKELRDIKNKGDDGMMDTDVVENKVRKTIEQMEHQKNLERSLHNTNDRLKSLEEKLGELDECPECHNRVPSNARHCPYCTAEFEQGGGGE